MLICPNCGSENPPDSRFCNRCGAVLAAPAPQTEVRKTVTVLFIDVTGSTDLGERLDPEALRRVMGRFFDGVQAVVERHGGTVEKFIGDAVMAVFGVPVLHEDDALRALRAAADIRSELISLNKELERDFGVTIATRTGVNTGEIVAGDPSTGQRLATGDAVNTAARLEQAAQPGEILIGDQTHRLARVAVVAEPLEQPLVLKGKEHPVPAYRLIEVLPDVEAIERHLDSPMVGRDDELELLEGAFRRSARERTGLLFTVLGSAGVGKSRLVQEFFGAVGDNGRVVRGRCLAYGDGITYWPLVEIVKEAARITEHDPPDEAVARIRALLPGEEQADLIAARVAEAIGVLEGTVPAEEIAWGVRKLFESLAREQPLVVVFDDIHWAEPTLLDLIEHVVDWSRDAPILLLCLARQELRDLRPAWGGGKLNATTIQLEPLTDEQSRSLVTNLLASELDEAVRARITEASEGNPLFVEQMVSMLIDDGFLERREDRWVATGRLEDVTVPPSIHALVAARLDRLGAEERAVIERAAVEGKTFHVGAVSALATVEVRPEVRRHLMALTRRELVRPDRAELQGEEAFRFRHQLIRDATYQAIPKELRAELHERFADWLSEKSGQHQAEYEEILGYHLEQAWRYRHELGQGPDATRELASRAAALLTDAGRRALARADGAAAAKLLRRARDLVPDRSREFVDVSLDLMDAAMDAGEFALGQDAADRAVVAAEELRDELLLAKARIAQLESRTPTDPERITSESPALVRAVTPILEAAGDDRGLARVSRLMVTVANMAADRTAMDEGIEKALEHARRAGDHASVGDLLTWRAANDYWGPMPAEEGLRRADEVLAELRDVPRLQARVRFFIAGFLAMQGRFDEARRLLAEVKDLYRERGERLWLASVGFLAGPIEIWSGNPAAAEEGLKANCEALEAMGERAWLCSIACFLAEVLYQQGKDKEADDWVERGRKWAVEDDVSAQADWRCVRAKLLARRGELEEAEALVREGLAIAERTDEIVHIADAWADLYEVLKMAGRGEEAAEAAREAIAIYERKGNVAAASLLRREVAG
jgi:class 3 adenylate cyclase/tetratricopeptide (TPR) repeat protein